MYRSEHADWAELIPRARTGARKTEGTSAEKDTLPGVEGKRKKCVWFYKNCLIWISSTIVTLIVIKWQCLIYLNLYFWIETGPFSIQSLQS